MKVGVVAAPGVTLDLAEDVAEDLPDELKERFPGVEWRVEVTRTRPAEPSADSRQLIDTLRQRLLEEGWDLAVGLTDLPLRSGTRPVSAVASASHGVALVSVPALGAVNLEARLRKVLADLVEGLLGETARRPGGGGEGRRDERIGRRLRELGSPLGEARRRDDGMVRFVGATLAGNLRLLVGMVRANQPSRVIARLSRAVVGALGTGAVGLTSQNVWRLADGMNWARLIGIALLSVTVTCAALVVAHGLWERASDPTARERVVLFNLVTVCTLALGVVTMYLALFLIGLALEGAFIPPSVFEKQLEHGVDLVDYIKLAWTTASLATIGGAVGSLVESDVNVRDAAYRNRADERIEEEADDEDEG